MHDFFKGTFGQRSLSMVFGYHWENERVENKGTKDDIVDEGAWKVTALKIASYIPLIGTIVAAYMCKKDTDLPQDCTKIEYFSPAGRAMFYFRWGMTALCAGALFIPADLVMTLGKGIRHLYDLKADKI